MRQSAILVTALVVLAGCSAIVGDDELTTGEPPPAIAINSPVSGTTVRSIITIASTVSSTASASSVRFDLPGAASVVDAAPPFSVTWDSTAVPDGSYTIQATAIDAGGATATTSATIIVANGPCLARFIAAGLPRRIPDASPVGLTSSLTITANASVSSLSLSLQITHPFPPDLQMALRSPSGALVSLDALISDPDAPGVIVADHIISAFDGQSAAGAWTLAVRDVAPGDVGWLDAWSLSLAGSCAPTSP